ncbi:transcriptional regulator [Actinoalloteichus sp. AHMU CJ021]|uniref:helix-turn-helix domain-containing protein n=1 Tax=Actinoalloteichus TaxID=65496 RepID=UPI00068E092E|nr:helix-turn-helix domain-containing protein [Actinoalloteichus caeruleus]AUS80985.1 transcriptional regulator [Actinoalloteichus sp. AHMU CJ021]
MDVDPRSPSTPGGGRRRSRRSLPDHPVRVALLDLLAEHGSLTSSEAGARLGRSSGVCSFHLRQLARHGLIEEVPSDDGRARPWRLRWGPTEDPDPHPKRTATLPSKDGVAVAAEDPGGSRHREVAEPSTPDAASFTAVLHLCPEEAAELAASMRRLVARYRERARPSPSRPSGGVPVAALVQLLPLLPEER